MLPLKSGSGISSPLGHHLLAMFDTFAHEVVTDRRDRIIKTLKIELTRTTLLTPSVAWG